MPYTRPTDLPEFCSADDPLDPERVQQPSPTKKAAGWAYREKPPRNWFNWLHRMHYLWTAWLDQQEVDHEGRIQALETAPVIDPQLPGLIFGCQCAYTFLVDAWMIIVSMGRCTSSDSNTIMNLPTSMQKGVINSAGTGWDGWVAGDENGGVGTGVGAIANGKWLHVFVIGNNAGTLVDAGFDDSITADNLRVQTGWTEYRRVGSIRIKSIGGGKFAINKFHQMDDMFWWDDPTEVPMYYQEHPGTSLDLTLTASVPPDILVFMRIMCTMRPYTSSGTGEAALLIHAVDETVYSPISSSIRCSLAGRADNVNSDAHFAEVQVMSNSAAQYKLKYVCAVTDLFILRSMVLGWMDNRGRLYTWN